MRKQKTVAISALLFVTLSVSAQTAQPANDQLRISLQEAEQLALKQNPGINVAKLLSLAQHQVTREVRSSELPNAIANLTAVDSHTGSRISAGGLNNPVIYQRAAGGVTVSQLITDFGRTRNLVASSQLRSNAAQDQELATQADVILAVDQAFYSALQSQALVNVASQTVATRQTTTDQVQALTNAKLKSDLDLSFANVNLAQAKLMLLDAEDQKASSFAALNTLLGFEKQNTYLLIDDTANSTPAAPPMTPDELIAKAMQSRPDLRAIEEQWQASEKFSRAEHDLLRPQVSALAAVGGAPVRADQLSPWYGAVGVNVSLPIFNGFQYSARAKEADYRAEALKEQVRETRDRIARDVQVTTMAANAAYQRISVTSQLLKQASLALDLAQTRYKLGLSSIVELSQAQLQQTEAEIGNTVARYTYEQSLSALAYQTGR